jgi:hypothetical protein
MKFREIPSYIKERFSSNDKWVEQSTAAEDLPNGSIGHVSIGLLPSDNEYYSPSIKLHPSDDIDPTRDENSYIVKVCRTIDGKLSHLIVIGDPKHKDGDSLSDLGKTFNFKLNSEEE